MRLSKDDWNKLNDLLSKHGFGGYYDLVECLKTVLRRIGDRKLKEGWDQEVKDLPGVVRLLLEVSKPENHDRPQEAYPSFY
ncbi:MAG: hypothetical protein OEZ48_00215 [Candidatus Bathyarchaeota archaeon]|nr:hypothetical protein [Candidatus Bathyarchaeota archaeon]MDH5686280.1 hypothetical protein [Candidatus Bathyarchaeota archaeon]